MQQTLDFFLFKCSLSTVSSVQVTDFSVAFSRSTGSCNSPTDSFSLELGNRSVSEREELEVNCVRDRPFLSTLGILKGQL